MCPQRALHGHVNIANFAPILAAALILTEVSA